MRMLTCLILACLLVVAYNWKSAFCTQFADTSALSESQKPTEATAAVRLLQALNVSRQAFEEAQATLQAAQVRRSCCG